jgi:hypothetical protein
MLLVALIAMGLALIRAAASVEPEAAALGVVVVVLVTPPLLRTLRVVSQRRASGRPITVLVFIATFLNSLVWLVSIAVASLCALLGACFAGSLLVVITIASMCRVVVVLFGRVGVRDSWLRRQVRLGTAYCASANIYLLRRFWMKLDRV